MTSPTTQINVLKLPFPVNALVLFRGFPWHFIGLANKDLAILQSIESLPPLEVDLRELTLLELPEVDLGRLRAFHEYPAAKQEVAQRRWLVIDQLLRDGLSQEGVEAAATSLGMSVQSMNKHLKWFIFSGGKKAILIPRVFRFGVSNHRLPEGVEAIIAEGIQRHHLTKTRKPFRAVMNFVERECVKRKYDIPCEETVRDRINRLPPNEVMLHQKGLRAVRERFEPLMRRRPDSPHPMYKIEIDHTRLNIFAVDRDGRKRRPWITLAIDDFSRAVLGFYISFDPPSWTSVALCMYRVLTPKDAWLREFGITEPWPCWGEPHTIQTDSASEFKGTDMDHVSLERNWVVQWRLLKTPEYGGRIERLMGAAAYAMEFLPGKTFRSITEKGDYKPEDHAVMSQEDLELYLLKFFAIYYNNKAHRSLRNRTPLNRWREGMVDLGDSSRIQPVPDPCLLMSLLPSIERTIQRDGISWETVNYFDYVLTRYIRRKNPESLSGQYRFHYHPADVRFLYFRLIGTQEWARIQGRDLGNGPLTIWERDARHLDDRAAAKDIESERLSKLGLSMMMDQSEEHERVSLKALRQKNRDTRKLNKLGAKSLPTLSMTEPDPSPRRMDLVPTDPSKFVTLPTDLDASMWDDIPTYKRRRL